MNEIEAYDKFTKENSVAFDVTTLGGKPEMDVYLSNRLSKAFIAGVAAGVDIERKRIKDSISKALFFSTTFE